MVRLDRYLRQNAQPHAGRNRGLDASEAGGGVSHVPGAAGALQRMDGARPVEAAGGKADQRHRTRLDIARMLLAGDPVHAFRPHRDAALLADGALEQREIKLAAIEVALEVEALVGADVEPQGRMRA